MRVPVVRLRGVQHRTGLFHASSRFIGARGAGYGRRVTDVFDRVEAMSAMVALWPSEATAGSSFAADATLCSAVPTFDIVRYQVLSSIRRLREAARLVEHDDGWGSHILMLRPSLVLVAKAAWIIRPDGSADRIGRALGNLLGDQRRGASAMRNAVSQGAISAFGDLADKYEANATALDVSTPIAAIRPPGDEVIIREMGLDVDLYYGTDDTLADVQLLWNASSSLAHGETWFNQLSGGLRPRGLDRVLTSRSFDAVCSGINVASLRITQLAAAETRLP